MQHGKCCYCELAISNDGPDKHVEHFRPQSRCEELKYEWDNLLLACAGCNVEKWCKFPVMDDGEPLLLDPSDPTLDPEDHIEFVVSQKQPAGRLPLGKLPLGLAIPRGQSRKGNKSIDVINLSGEHHTRRRRETLFKLSSWRRSLMDELNLMASGDGNAHEIDRLKNKLLEACGDDQAYAGLARTFYRVHQV